MLVSPFMNHGMWPGCVGIVVLFFFWTTDGYCWVIKPWLNQAMKLPWNYHEITMKLPWNYHGTSWNHEIDHCHHLRCRNSTEKFHRSSFVETISWTKVYEVLCFHGPKFVGVSARNEGAGRPKKNPSWTKIPLISIGKNPGKTPRMFEFSRCQWLIKDCKWIII